MSDENINININVITKKSVVQAGNDLEGLGKKGQSAGEKIAQSMDTADQALKGMKIAVGVLTAALATMTVVAAKSISAFKQFENGLVNVQKVTNLSGARLQAFGKEIDNLANRIPVGTSELLNLSQTAGQLGIEGARNILLFSESVALLTRTTDLTTESAIQIAQLLAVSKTAPENIGRLSAVLVDLGNNFSATESQILEVSTRIAQSSTAYNLLAEDSITLGAVIAGVGEKAEASGTAIGKSFRALEEAIKLGGEPLRELTRLTGLQREELASLFESNPTELLRQFTAGVGEASKSGEIISVILDTFGLRTDRVNRVLTPLIKNTQAFDEAAKRTAIQMRDQSAAVEEARKQFATLESAEILAGNATSELGKTIGQVLEPAYRSILETVRSVAIATTRFIEDNAPLIKVITVAIGALTATLGFAAAAVYAKSAAWAALSASATAAWSAIILPALPAIAAIAAVGVALAAIVSYWEEIKLAIDIVVVAILEITAKVLNFFADFESSGRKALAVVANLFIDFFDTVSGGLQTLIKVIDRVFGTDLTANITAFRKNLKESVKTFEEGDGALKGLAKTAKGVAEVIEEGIVAQIADRQQKEETKKAIRALEDEERRLQDVILNGSDAQVIAANKRLKAISEEKLALRGLLEEKKKVDQETIDANTEKVDKLKEIEIQYLGDIQNLQKIANDETVDGIEEVLRKQKEEKIKAYRDQAIADNEFNEARRAELLLDSLEQERIVEESERKKKQKAIDAQLEKVEEIRKINENEKQLDEEKALIEAELKVQTDEEELEVLRLRLEQIEIAKTEARAREAELEGSHLELIRKQRELEDKKRIQSLRKRTDEEIRREQSTAQLKRIIAQTSAQQLIGIGDNLMQAGIVQGKTAGKALKALKIGEAIVNTYAGASNALSSIPYPANLLAAASVIATGLANVATISAQKFATGGVVQAAGPGSRGIDNVPALLSVGEEVLTRNNPRHRDNIAREQDQALLEAINGLRSDMQNMQTIVTIDGKEVADALQTQRFRGVN